MILIPRMMPSPWKPKSRKVAWANGETKRAILTRYIDVTGLLRWPLVPFQFGPFWTGADKLVRLPEREPVVASAYSRAF
jgi:hypothetical protein